MKKINSATFLAEFGESYRLFYSIFIAFFMFWPFLYVLINKWKYFKNDVVFMKDSNFHNTVFIAVMVKASFEEEIIYYKNYFFDSFLSRTYANDIKFYGDDPIKSVGKDFPYVPVDYSYDLSRHYLCSKLRVAMKHFLFETTASWFVRICGDTYMNFRTFPLFLQEINSSYNPLLENVIQGACLGKEQLVYIQGGSGFVFSRNAVFTIYNDWDWLNNTCVLYKNDDRALSLYLKRINISFHEATSRWFVGHRFFGYKSARDAIYDPRPQPKCGNKPLSKKGCRAYYTRVKDLVFWHDKSPFMEFIGQIESITNRTKDNLFFSVPNNKPMLCQASRKIKQGYYN